MRIHFYSPNRIEPWDYRNVFDVGIGGSETSAVEMAMRLAARGHEVTSYTDLPMDCPDEEFGGVHWRDLCQADLNEDGLWIVYRKPSVGLECVPTANRRYWLVCQDVFYPDWTSESVKSFDRIIGLCPRHVQEIISRDPTCKDRVCMSSNGVNVEMIEEQEHTERNPQRLIWTSSPDRGLKEVLDIFERAREQVPTLELKIFYGLDNILMITGGDRKKQPWKISFDLEDRARSMPGVEWIGRIGQRQLKRELFAAGIWLYPTWFPETSAISCMEAQACGCIPITNPIWATGYNVRHGVMIEGTPNDPLVKARYVDAVVRIASDPEAQDRLRIDMMRDARERFDWDVWVDQWESWMEVPCAVGA